MKWTNYHNHCHYCDGKNSMEDHVKSAIEHGICSFGMSCHCPVPFENGWSMNQSDLETYLDEIDQLKSKYEDSIRFHKSLEVDFIPNMSGPKHPLVMEADLDYVIGSLHFVGAFDDGQPCVIDGPHNAFLKGLKLIHHNDTEKAVKMFYDLTRQMIRNQCPDIIGHFDKIRMQNKHNLWDESSKWYQNEVLHTLEEIKGSKAIVEVNTRGIYKKVTKEPYPGLWALDQIKALDIPICINSDAHQPKEVTAIFSETAKMLNQKGFKKVMVFMDGEWVPRPFSEDGIHIEHA